MAIYRTSDMNLADGVPVVWASKFFNDPIQGRVTGLDVLTEFAKKTFLNSSLGLNKDQIIKPNSVADTGYMPNLERHFSFCSGPFKS